MCEITNKNFEEKLPEIIKNLSSASFISIDCEFSGLYESEQYNSMFESAEQIFYKKQKNIANYHIVEFGLSTFHLDRHTNNFNVTSYSFYLLPFVNHKKNSKFTWQLTSVDFLCAYNFNFNKVFYEGVSYVNKMEEEEIFEMINKGTICEIFNQEDIQNYKCQVYRWLKTAKEGDEFIIELEARQLSLTHVVQLEIRKTIPQVWTSSSSWNVIKVRKVSVNEKSRLLADQREENALRGKLFDSIWGFSKIMRQIEEMKKPVVGHNVLVDLILIYLQFYNKKYVTYREFKKDIHRIFPCVFDTKILCSSLVMKIPRDECWSSTRLCDLYTYFKKGIGGTRFIMAPMVVTKEENYSNSNNFHDAGFDSYCTGYCFVKMSYMHLMWDEDKNRFVYTTVSKTFTALMASIKHVSNRLYVPRSEVKWIDLSGPDPKKDPPTLLLICTKGNMKLNSSEIAEKLSQYYSAEYKPLNKCSGMIAVGNKNHVKEIRNYFEMNKDYIVSDYSFLKHSFWGKALIKGFFISAFLVITSKVLRLSKFVRMN